MQLFDYLIIYLFFFLINLFNFIYSLILPSSAPAPTPAKLGWDSIILN